MTKRRWHWSAHAKRIGARSRRLVILWDWLMVKLWIWGIPLPGRKAAHKRLPAQLAAALERELLIRRIKATHYVLSFGPLWFRRAADTIFSWWLHYRIVLLLSLKAILSLVLVGVPVAVFLLVRVFLPVPERVILAGPETKPQWGHTRTDWLYWPNDSLSTTVPPQAVNVVPPGQLRGFAVSPVVTAPGALAFAQIGIESAPFHLHRFQGVLVGEGASISLKKMRKSLFDIADGNRLRVRGALFPSEKSTAGCSLRIFDEANHLLAHVRGDPEDPLRAATSQFFGRLMGNLVPRRRPGGDRVFEVAIDSSHPPAELTFVVTAGMNESAQQSTIYPDASPSLKDMWFPKWATNTRFSVHDISQAQCLFAVGDLAFEHGVVSPPPLRGVVVLAVDGLSQGDAANRKLMPNLANFAEHSTVFTDAIATERVPSIAYSALLGDVSSSKNLPAVARQLGYRTVAFGRLTTDESMRWPESWTIQSTSYETPTLFAETLRWLQLHGQAAFFTFLRSRSLTTSLRPPITAVSLRTAAREILIGDGLAAEIRRANLRAWDTEFGRFLDGMERLGLKDNTAIVVTGTSGRKANSTNNWEEHQIRVPLIVGLPQAEPKVAKVGLTTLQDAAVLIQDLLVAGHRNGLTDWEAQIPPRESVLIRGEKSLGIIGVNGLLYRRRTPADGGEDLTQIWSDSSIIHIDPVRMRELREQVWTLTKASHHVIIESLHPNELDLVVAMVPQGEVPPSEPVALQIPESMRFEPLLQAGPGRVIRISGTMETNDLLRMDLSGWSITSIRGQTGEILTCQNRVKLNVGDLPWAFDKLWCLSEAPKNEDNGLTQPLDGVSLVVWKGPYQLRPFAGTLQAETN